MMGVTIKCKKTGRSYDLSYSGFYRFRQKVADLCSQEFGSLYEMLTPKNVAVVCFTTRCSEKEVYDLVGRETERLIMDGKVHKKVVDFCFEPDTDGSIRYGACKVIYEHIKDHEDNKPYGYVGRQDCAMWDDLKDLFRECAETKSDLVWR